MSQTVTKCLANVLVWVLLVSCSNSTVLPDESGSKSALVTSFQGLNEDWIGKYLFFYKARIGSDNEIILVPQTITQVNRDGNFDLAFPDDPRNEIFNFCGTKVAGHIIVSTNLSPKPFPENEADIEAVVYLGSPTENRALKGVIMHFYSYTDVDIERLGTVEFADGDCSVSLKVGWNRIVFDGRLSPTRVYTSYEIPAGFIWRVWDF